MIEKLYELKYDAPFVPFTIVTKNKGDYSIDHPKEIAFPPNRKGQMFVVWHGGGCTVLKFDAGMDVVSSTNVDQCLKCGIFDRVGFTVVGRNTADCRSWSYSVLMSFPQLLSLHHYFVVAARMQHHFESNLVAVEESRVTASQDPDLAALELFSGPRGNFMYYWYASLYVVVQGFRNLKLVDPRIDALLVSPNFKALRWCWNGIFHFQPDYFSKKLFEPVQAPDFAGWVRELMEAFRAYFAREMRPVES